MSFPLEYADPSSLRLNGEALARLDRAIRKHIEDGRYPGAQVAVARDGKLAMFKTYGRAKITPAPVDAGDDTLWLMFSNTKVVTAAAIWALAEAGEIRYTDFVAEHVPEFARNGKREITVHQVLTHQAGFPNAVMPEAAWDDHELMKRCVCDFSLEWTPGSRVHYHSAAAHWTAAMLIEKITGKDFRDYIREAVIAPLGLEGELFVGLPDPEHGRAADIHEPAADTGETVILEERNTPAAKRAGIPGGGGYATARAMAAFYQMMANRGTLNGVRVFSPRTIEYVSRNHTGDRLDENFGMPMHRGIGPHVRGYTPNIRGLGSIASPRTFGHGGVGSSYCWADPESGTSFAYFSNSRIPEPWHSLRMDHVSNFAHAAIEP